MIVVHGDGSLHCTRLADSWDAQVDALAVAADIGGMVGAVPVLHDFRPEPAGG